MNDGNTTAFTLIELLIVVSIIGILAAIAIPIYSNASLKAEIASTHARMKNAHTAISEYMLDHQMFPPHGITGSYDRPYAFSALTTPVNYLDSIDRCVDTFRQYDFPPDLLGERVFSKTYFMYDAKTAYDLYGFSSYQFTKDYNDVIRYLMASTGPDGWSYNMYFSLIAPTKVFISNLRLMYSTTNGLRSCGDIISSNVRTYE